MYMKEVLKFDVKQVPDCFALQHCASFFKPHNILVHTADYAQQQAATAMVATIRIAAVAQVNQ